MATNLGPPQQTNPTFCLACGYMLRDLTSDRCPECGRPFDPADPRTMSVGRPLRSWQRRLLRPIGWPIIFLSLLGTGGLAFLSYRPHLQPEPWSVLRDEFRSPVQIPRPLTTPDKIFYASIALWVVFLVLFTFRQLARLMVPSVARRALRHPPTLRRRRMALGIVIAITVFCMIFGWQQRIGRRWMARVSTEPTALGLFWDCKGNDASGQPLFRFSAGQGGSILGNLVTDMPTARERLMVAKVLVESNGRAAQSALTRAAGRENDTDLLAWELRLIGLCRNSAAEALLIGFMQDSRPEIRSAAADAVGILRHPSYSVAVPNDFWVARPLALDSSPPIIARTLVRPVSTGPNFHDPPFTDHDLQDDPIIAINPSARPTLQKMMTDGTSQQEREAAARTLVSWPPDKFNFRVAEWGVWIDYAGNLALAKSIIDEIPPFVHQTGNSTNAFNEYFLYPSIVTKPIVHLTVDVPLAADVQVFIREGRPWFGYPMPDDFLLGDWDITKNAYEFDQAHRSANPASSAPDDFDAPSIKVLADCREGYPWLVPHHRLSRATWLSLPISYDLGLRWQSLIICPTEASWMTPPTIPTDPRYKWWARLRGVPSSWIANRGESERFLYYDGPTRSAVPATVIFDAPGHRLRFKALPPEQVEYFQSDAEKQPFRSIGSIGRNDLPPYEGIYVDVRAGVINGEHMIVHPGTSIELETNPPLQGDAVVQRFREMLITYGLTADEAEGLVAAWTPQFFQTDGRRFVLRMSPADYARQCPMQVRPTPTTVVRLGLILTEFDAKAAVSH